MILAIGLATAQTYDVGIKNILNPANGDKLCAGNTNVVITLANYGDSLAPSDSIKIGFSLNGINKTASAWAPSIGYGKGDTVNLRLRLNLSSLMVGSNTLCFRTTKIVGKTDADSTNDQSCSTFTIVKPDLSIDSIAITNPAVNNGDTLLTNTHVSSMYVRIRNNGLAPYTTTPISMMLSINGTTSKLNLPIQRAIAPNGAAKGNIPAQLINVQPNTVGLYEVCAATTVKNDADTTNDQTCISFSVHDVLTINGLSPEKGVEGSYVTISGNGFSRAATKNIVMFNGTKAMVSNATSTSITAKVPVGATTGKIKVMAYNQEATSTIDFKIEKVTPLTINTLDGIDNKLYYSNKSLNYNLSNWSAAKADLYITDTSGKVVLTQSIPTNQSGQINLAELTNGTYIVSLGTSVYKFVK